MDTHKEISTKLIFVGSVVISVLVAVSAIYSLYTPNFYKLETENWEVQSIAQDIFDLFVAVPILIITALLANSGNKTALLLWAGTLLYLIYSYVIYCFSVHFNVLFLVYCTILSASFYLFAYFITFQFKRPIIKEITNPLTIKVTAFYFIFISISFYFLWLSDIIKSLYNGTQPTVLVETGLPTNAVHVLDLTFLLPGIIIIAILLLRKSPLALVLAPIVLSFLILMSASIALIAILLTQNNLAQGYAVPVMMGVLVLISTIITFLYLKGTKLNGV